MIDHRHATEFGFEWGPMRVQRICTIRKGERIIGRVVEVVTERDRIELWVTPTGLIRVSRHATGGV